LYLYMASYLKMYSTDLNQIYIFDRHAGDDDSYNIHLACSANLPTGLCILLALISSSLFFFNMSKAISLSTGPIFTIFSPNGRYLREFSRSGPVFPIPQWTVPWQPILCRKQKNTCDFCNFYTI